MHQDRTEVHGWRVVSSELVTRLAMIVTQTFIPMQYKCVICTTIKFAEALESNGIKEPHFWNEAH